MSGRTVRAIVSMALLLATIQSFSQDAPYVKGAEFRVSVMQGSSPANWTLASNNQTSPTDQTNPANPTETGQAATDNNDTTVPSDPASLDVEFDVGDLEEFDSDDFDLAAVDPEADAELRGMVQNVLIVAGLVTAALIGLVIYIRAKRKQ